MAVVIALIVWSTAGAAGVEWREAAGERVSVLYVDPALADYAAGAAVRAEAALDVLEELFGTVPERVTLTLDGRTDFYSAVAPPLPRPRVSLPALFPAVPQIDLRSRDPLYDLLLHELTHVVQLAMLDLPDGAGPLLPRLGLVGEAIAPVPPGWLLEGLAVWVAGRHSPGAAFPDSRTRGLLDTLAIEGDWPTLADVSLLSHAEWPAGEARYLLGGAFVDRLVERHGWETLVAALREANAGWHPLPFASAWRRAAGTELEAEWRAWSEEVRDGALERLGRPGARDSARLLEGGRASTVMSLRPDGERLAWRPADGGLAISSVTPTGLNGTTLVLPASRTPMALDWAGPDRLVYARLAAGPDDRFTDLFELDLRSGEEVRLTHGERPRFPQAGPDGCVFYVRDVVGEGSRVRRLCREEEPVDVYRAPPGTHLVGLAVSPGGVMAASLWRNGRVDLALLEGGEARYLTRDDAQELDPTWNGEDELVFRSDRSGVFDLWALRPGEQVVRRLTAEIGGAFTPVVAPRRDTVRDGASRETGAVTFARLGGDGYGIGMVPADGALQRTRLEREPPPAAPEFAGSPESRGYDPWPSLAPYGWLPRLEWVGGSRPAVAATLLGQDDSGDHSWSAEVGYAPGLPGPLGGAWAKVRYDFRAVDALDLFQRLPPVVFGVQIGMWPHSPYLLPEAEVAAGAVARLELRSPLGSWSGAARLELGALHLASHGALQPTARFDAVAGRRRGDVWGYATAGSRAGLHAVWSPSAGGGAGGVWIDGSSTLPANPGRPFTVEAVGRAGYRAPLPVPAAAAGWAVSASVGARDGLPVRWRYADGVIALERLTVETRLHAWYGGEAKFGADASLWGDLMIRYGAPVSLGATLGWYDGFWYRVGARLPL